MSGAGRLAVQTVSVRRLVNWALTAGDLTAAFRDRRLALVGAERHRQLQAALDGRAGLTTELRLRHCVTGDAVELEVTGRADAVWLDNGTTVVEELKLAGSGDPRANPLHWAQAACYAFMVANERGLPSVDVQLTYYPEREADGPPFSFRRSLSNAELDAAFCAVVEPYVAWLEQQAQWLRRRNVSVSQSGFPFGAYRRGQQELVSAVSECIEQGGELFVEAPTGIGKTLAVLTPALRALAAGTTERVFYLTAKGTTSAVAAEACAALRRAGHQLKSVTITARDKLCFCRAAGADPTTCSYARGHFDRIRPARAELFDCQEVTRAMVEQAAHRHHVCPFELSLDATTWCDVVICDYHYAFDPRVRLRRHFDDRATSYTLLIDEAHNLVDRGRDMFSAALGRRQARALARAVGEQVPELAAAATELAGTIDRLRVGLLADGQTAAALASPPDEIRAPAFGFEQVAASWLARGHEATWRADLLELYYAVRAFLAALDRYDAGYRTIVEAAAGDVRVTLFCVDPGTQLRPVLSRVRAAVLFSATLTPLDYYVALLGGSDSSARLRLPSPFVTDNLLLIVDASVSTRFKARAGSYEHIARRLGELVERPGHYLSFFPSYDYLARVLSRFEVLFPQVATIVQRRTMVDAERAAVLDRFRAAVGESLLGFAVMGGLFAEGIDLPGNALSGAAIIGVGLPRVAAERDVVRAVFDERSEHGFEFAYAYPGLSRVLQAAGRVIRGEDDRGVVMLIGERFGSDAYLELLPPHWRPFVTTDGGSLQEALDLFWAGQDDAGAEPAAR